MIGRSLSHYCLLEQIGAGGMGTVFRAQDTRLERDVAVKILNPGVDPDLSSRKRFRHEALTLSRLNHPNVQTVHDFDTHEGVDFIVSEWIAGECLDDRIVRGPLPEDEVIRLGRQLAEGLAAAHSEGIVHRDVSPSNVRVNPSGQLKILDFGIARGHASVNASSRTETVDGERHVSGTVPYMAPEQLLGHRVGPAADIYSAGAILYQMATGRRPFPEIQFAELIDAVLNRPPEAPRTLNPRISAGLEGVLLRALAKKPEDRFLTAADLESALAMLAEGGHVAPASVFGARPWRAVAVTAGALVFFFLGVLFVYGVGGVWGGPPFRSHARTTVAVLPLANLSGDPAAAYLSAGMTDALISELAGIESLSVVSRTTSRHYGNREYGKTSARRVSTLGAVVHGSQKTLLDIGRELGVEALVEGSLRCTEDRVLVTVRFVDARTDRTLWVRTYEHDREGAFSSQTHVARLVARQVEKWLEGSGEIGPLGRNRLAVRNRPRTRDTSLLRSIRSSTGCGAPTPVESTAAPRLSRPGTISPQPS